MRRRSIGSNRAGAGFTLVELLVVLAIILVLIALLLPVGQKVRQQANRVACAASLRQVYAGVIMYVNDNKGVMPMGRFRRASAAPTWWWSDFVALYLQPKNSVRFWAENPNADYDEWKEGPVTYRRLRPHWRHNSAIWAGCPNWEPEPEIQHIASYTYNIFPHDPDPGPSLWLSYPPSDAAPWGSGKFQKLTRISHKSERALMADGTQTLHIRSGWYWDDNKSVEEQIDDMDVRHGRPMEQNAVNVLFFAGHVKSLSAKDAMLSFADPLRSGRRPGWPHGSG